MALQCFGCVARAMGCGFDDDDLDPMSMIEMQVNHDDLPPELENFGIAELHPSSAEPTAALEISSSPPRPSTPPTSDLAVQTPPSSSSRDLGELVSEPKRRRLSRKTSPGAVSHSSGKVVLPQCAPDTEPTAVPGESSTGDLCKRFPSLATFDSWKRRRQYDWIYDQVRLKFTRMGGLSKSKKPLGYREARALFKDLPKRKKFDFAVEWMDHTNAPLYIRQAVESFFGEKEQMTSRLFGKTLLVTYNGDWGYRSSGEWLDTKDLTLSQLIDVLRADADITKLWEDFKAFAEERQTQYLCSDFACAMEVCTTTFKEEHRGRVHFHFWLRSNRRIFVSTMESLAFQGVGCHLASCVGGIVKDTRAASFQGAFYCSSIKVGSVHSHCTREMHSGYLVQPTWFLNMLQSGKISFADARAGIHRSCQNVQRHMQDLDAIEAESLVKAQKAEQERALKALALRKKPFVQIPAVLSWAKSYDEDNFRFSFLVLDGPSKLGKTQFGLSLTPKDMSYLELNCAGGGPIDLRGFKYGVHGLILYDEIVPEQVLAQRKAFQASPSEVQLGQSATSIYSYTVFLYKVRMVLCSNKWSSLMRTLPKDDHDWLESNMVYISVTETLFAK